MSIQSQTDLDSRDLDLIDLTINWWKPLLILAIITAFLAYCGSFLIEEKYESKVIFIPFIQNADYNAQSKFGERKDAEFLLQLSNSRRIKERTITEFNLWEHYGIKKNSKESKANILRTFDNNIRASLTRYGAVTINVRDKDPQTAMDVANFMSNMIDTISNELRINAIQKNYNNTAHLYHKSIAYKTVLEDSMIALIDLGVYDYETQVKGLSEQYNKAVSDDNPRLANKMTEALIKIGRYKNTSTNLEDAIRLSNINANNISNKMGALKIEMESERAIKSILESASLSDKRAHPNRLSIMILSVFGTLLFSISMILLSRSFLKYQKKSNP